jgi:formylglycine-generating enzyme required for sulfatase activity
MIGKALMRGFLAAAAAVFAAATIAHAITIDLVPVGDPGNAADTRVMNDGTSGYGSVPCTYAIGKYEITAAQYTPFLNAVAKWEDTYGLYNSSMPGTCGIQQSPTPGNYTYSVASDWANRPVNYVSFWDAARFANWLHNGQPGLVTPVPQDQNSTEDGAYTLNGYTGSDGRTIGKNDRARFWIPSENEWYKAAYYKGGGTSAGYWAFPTRSDTLPSNILSNPDPGNNANFYDDVGTGNGTYTIGGPYWRTEVGAFTNSKSAYNTFDQGGNVWEWNDTVVEQGPGWSCRGIRGGDFADGWVNMHAYYRSNAGLEGGSSTGFRVAGVPEPGGIALLICGALAALLWRCRRRWQAL